MITAEEYIEINKLGLAHRLTGDWNSYYTPVFNIAYTLGQDGVDISDCKEIEGFRFGGTPERFISTNWADNTGENGLSVYEEGDIVRCEFAERGDKKYFKGLKVDTGSDGEAIILAFDAENWDK